MSESNKRVFRCDVPGCKSYCELSSAVIEEDVNNALEARGWKVRGDQHLCPGHEGNWGKVPVPSSREGSD